MGGCFSKKGDKDHHGFQNMSHDNRDPPTDPAPEESDKPLPKVPEEQHTPPVAPAGQQVGDVNDPIVRDFAQEHRDSLEITPAPPIGGYPDDYTGRDTKLSGRTT